MEGLTYLGLRMRRESKITPSIGPVSVTLVLLTVLTFFLAAAVTAAQESSGAWQGIVQNPAGAPVPDAVVRLAGKSGAIAAKTDGEGKFEFKGITAGLYNLSVDANGRSVKAAGLIALDPAAGAVVLTLSDQGVAISELSLGEPKTTGGEKLSSQKVNELPLNKRDFSQLLLLAAGTMTDANGATNFTAQFAINGQRGVEATFAMDGADISDPEMGGSTFSNFNVDAVQEIKSVSGWVPAEVGRGASGFTDIITRSGASGFHGSFFEFVRNSAFDARNYFDHATPAYPGRIPPFRRNEFGFTNGGPVYLPHLYDGRKRTFYFVQSQAFRQVLGTTQVMPVPTADERPNNTTCPVSGHVCDAITYP